MVLEPEPLERALLAASIRGLSVRSERKILGEALSLYPLFCPFTFFFTIKK